MAKKFNLTAAKAGKAVVTRLGNDVKIDYIGPKFLLATITSKVGIHMNTQVRCNLDGSRFSPKHEHFQDLFMK